jgi:hypothetical protein
VPDWKDRYLGGDCVGVWTEITSIEATTGLDQAESLAAEAVAIETMRRCRENVDRLVELLPTIGYQFQPGEGLAVHQAPSPTVVGEVAQMEERVGTLPTALRAWYLEVGEVNLMGTPPAGWCDYPDPLVVQAPVAYVLGEREAWELDRGTRWDRGPFVIDFAPDYLHKGNVSGGAPYSIAVTGDGVDGCVLWERHQTTFVNYLRIAFQAGGMPGFGFSSVEFPNELRSIANQLLRI